MGDQEEIRDLLREVRDLQREHVDLYRANSERAILTQEEASARQKVAVQFYQRVIFVTGPIIVFIIGLIIYLLSLL
jgi:phage host-nuclease inhibitor protein Gam